MGTLTRDGALRIASRHLNNIDSYRENTDAFIFGNSKDREIENSPIVVMKTSWQVMNLGDYLDLGTGILVEDGTI